MADSLEHGIIQSYIFEVIKYFILGDLTKNKWADRSVNERFRPLFGDTGYLVAMNRRIREWRCIWLILRFSEGKYTVYST